MVSLTAEDLSFDGEVETFSEYLFKKYAAR